MSKRKLITFKYAFGGNSEAIKNYLTSNDVLKEFKKEYSRLRDAERKQIERLEKSEFSQLQSAQQKLAPKLSLDEVYWPCSHSRAIPSFPSQLEWKIGLAWANTRGSLNSPS